GGVGANRGALAGGDPRNRLDAGRAHGAGRPQPAPARGGAPRARAGAGGRPVALPAAEAGELEAFVDLYEAAPPELGARLELIGGAACFALTAVPHSAMFNRALGLRVGGPATEADLDT